MLTSCYHGACAYFRRTESGLSIPDTDWFAAGGSGGGDLHHMLDVNTINANKCHLD